jgi:hypothetical protein
MAGCLFMLSILFFVIGLVVLLVPTPSGQTNSGLMPVTSSSSRQSTRGYTPVTPILPGHPGASTPIQTSNPQGGSMEPVLQKLAWLKVGQQIRVPHSVRGELTVHVQGRILFTELWQQSRSPQSPWVPTGNQFAGFWLNGEMLLLNWQSRFYLLDENNTVSDSDIARDFAPHARKFAQSDQSADVYFAYPPASWHIDDIGKFRIDAVEGSTLPVRVGAIGRFVHASGDGGRALVLEDYEGGAQDTVWIGWQLKEEDIRKA